jgi:hypothetical protein
LTAKLVAAKDTVHTQRDIVRIAPRRAAAEQAAVVELSKLTPPASMAGQYRQIVAARRGIAEDIAKVGEYAASKNHPQERRLLLASARLIVQMRATAQRSGFKDCAQIE